MTEKPKFCQRHEREKKQLWRDSLLAALHGGQTCMEAQATARTIMNEYDWEYNPYLPKYTLGGPYIQALNDWDIQVKKNAESKPVEP